MREHQRKLQFCESEVEGEITPYMAVCTYCTARFSQALALMLHLALTLKCGPSYHASKYEGFSRGYIFIVFVEYVDAFTFLLAIVAIREL